MTLYEIDKRLYEMAEAMLDPETGELTGDPEAWAELQMARDEKLENTALFVKNLRSEALAIKGEENTLAKRRKRLERKITWLESNLRASLDGQMFETSKCSIKFKKNPESVRILDEQATMNWAYQFAQDCIRYAQPELSKSALKERLKEGEAIPGAELVRETRMEVL